MSQARHFLALGSILALLGVALGAFAAHGLEKRLSAEALAWWETGVRYQMYHALALFAVAWGVDRLGGRLPVWAGRLFVAGIVVFSGSLYLLALTNIRRWGMVTPLGGAAFLAGWALLAVAALKNK